MKQAKPVAVAHLGLVLDKPPEEVGVESWTGGRNVAFRDGMTYRTGGWSRYAAPLMWNNPLFAMNVIIGANSYWIYASSVKIGVTDGATHWDITPAAGLSPSTAGDWSGCILNGIPCLNNGADVPLYWNRSVGSPCAPLPGWPATARCKALRAAKYHLIALNITDSGVNYGSQLWWSAAAAAGAIPQEWLPTASNDAGDAVLGDTPGDIVDGLALRDTFIVYKNFATHILQYVAGTYVFTSRKLFETSGIQALNCVVEANGLHWVLTGTDVIRHDGQSFVSVVDEKVKRTLIQSIDQGKVRMCCVEARLLNKQVWVCIPETGSGWLSKAYVIDVTTGDIGVRSLPPAAIVRRGIIVPTVVVNSWNDDPGSWESDTTFWDQQTFNPTQDSMLMVDPVNSLLYSVDASELGDGFAIFAYVERLGAALGNFDSHKVVTELTPRIKGRPGDVLQITLGGQPWFNQPITWGAPQDFVIGTDTKVNDIVEGRLLSVRFEGTTQGVWELHRYAVKYTEVGEQ